MVQIHLKQNTFDPGVDIEGEVSWADLESEENIEIRLIWFTSGKGTRDIEIVNTIDVPVGSANGKERFRIAGPGYPYSFSGKLISLIWAVEAVVMPSRDSATTEILIAPGEVEVVLSKDPLE